MLKQIRVKNMVPDHFSGYVRKNKLRKVHGECKPTVAIINGCHAATLKSDNGIDYVFKNSYGANSYENPVWIEIPKHDRPTTQR